MRATKEEDDQLRALTEENDESSILPEIPGVNAVLVFSCAIRTGR